MARPASFEALRSFLRRNAPAYVIVHTELGDRTMQCKSQAWREIADSIISMKPHGVIEAYEPKGLLLRTFECSRLVDDKAAELVPQSAFQSDMQFIGRLLGEAYRHSTEVAFMQVVDVVRIALKRNEEQEGLLMKLIRDRAKELEKEEATQGEGSLEEQVMGAVVGNMMRGQMEKAVSEAVAPQPKPKNGK